MQVQDVGPMPRPEVARTGSLTGLHSTGPVCRAGRGTIDRVEDPAVTEGVRSRDPETLQLVVRQHLPMLLRAARAGGLSPDQAEDVVQETLLTFLTRAPDFDGRARVRTWLYGILLKKLSRAFKTAGRDRELEAFDERLEARFDHEGRWTRLPPQPDVGGDRERVRGWLSRCLEVMPARRRMAFILRDVEELPSAEVCQILGISPTYLGVLLFRARTGLRECLAAKGLSSHRDADL